MIFSGQIFSGQRVSVIGSAPGVAAPMDSTTNIFANESPVLAGRLNLFVDYTVLSSFIFFDKDARDVAHLKMMEGLHLGHVIVLETYISAAVAVAVMDARGIRFDSVTPLTAVNHAALVVSVTGEPLGRHVVDGSSPEYSVSTGLYCACMALANGADSVCLCGISLKPGYEHTEIKDKVRGHLTGDTRCLQLLQEKYADRLTTTSDELHREFGITRIR